MSRLIFNYGLSQTFVDQPESSALASQMLPNYTKSSLNKRLIGYVTLTPLWMDSIQAHLHEHLF